MAGAVYELNPVNFLTTGFIGQPGKRVFYLQAGHDQQVVTLVVEKLQVEALAQGILEFLRELQEKFPNLTAAEANYRADQMRLQTPLDPAFRVGQMGLGYDSDRDLVVLVAQEVTTEERSADDAGVARLFATRAQMRTLAEHGRSIVQQGRPTCPLCGQPIDPDSHFCPRRNGHRY